MKPLAERDLFWFLGVDRQPTIVSVHQLYDAVTPITLVLTRTEDMEFCDSLDLVYGKQLKRMFLWDWHDWAWDQQYPSRDNPYPTPLRDQLRDVVCDRYDMIHLVQRPHIINKMMKDEQRRQLVLLEPQPYFDPKEMLDVPLLLSERKTRWNR